jgi:VWFA-related protein
MRAEQDKEAEPAAVPRIPGGQAERVTVDVVVLDDKGQPVKSLNRDDFLVYDEGKRQTVDSFELVDRAASSPVTAPEVTRMATNLVSPEEEARGRTFVILFDDLHLTPHYSQAAKKAVVALIDKGMVAGDKVTLISTSGSTWWTTFMPRGREDLVDILKRLEGRLIRENAMERIGDYEALQIFYYHDARMARRVEERLEQYSTKHKTEMSSWQAENMAEMFLRGAVHPYIEMRAMRTYFALRSRMEASLSVMERAVRALSEGRDRKSLVLISEGFVDDPSQEGIKRLVTVARQVNAAVYFVDVSGLRLLNPMYSAEFGNQAVDAGDLLGAIADLSREGEGAVALAEKTGGFAIRDSNDFENGAARIGLESQSFYLIGYDPGDIPHDGRFRSLKVRVRGDFTVRARRGYYAPTEDGSLPGAEKKGKVDPQLQHALDAPTGVRGIPLRMTTYVLDEMGLDWVRVLMVADADVSKMGFKEVEGTRVGTLDTLAVIGHRDSDFAQRDDQQVDLRLRAGAGKGPVWYSFVREFGLPSGRHQARLVIRDPATNRVGSVIYEFDVPPQDKLRVSTPVLTTRLTESRGGSPTPALVVDRAFAPGSLLYCRFDVFGAKRGTDGMPRVRSGYALRRKEGETLGTVAPTFIKPTSMGALARLMEIPLRRMSPGEYELVLTVEDEVAGDSRKLVEGFSIAPARVSSRD